MDYFGLSRFIHLTESWPERDGLYIVPRHAELIASGKKTLVVKSRKFDVAGKKFYLITEDRILGEIELESPEPIDEEEFQKRRKEHSITPEERKAWWPEVEQLFAYQIKSFKRFDPPLAYNRKPGVQTFQKNVRPLAEIVTEETRSVQFNLLHRSWKGPIVIRAGRRGHDWIVMYPAPGRERGFMAFHLNRSPLQEDKIAATLEITDDEFFNFTGQIPPEHPVNPLKELPIDQEILDKGKAIILEDSASFKKLTFQGKRLKGTWAFRLADELWQMERSRGPGGRRSR